MLKEGFRHPECQENELWLGCTTKEGFKRINYASKRLGTVAYSNNGTIIPPEHELFPLFVSRREFRTNTLRLIPVCPENPAIWMTFCLTIRRCFSLLMTGKEPAETMIKN